MLNKHHLIRHLSKVMPAIEIQIDRREEAGADHNKLVFIFFKTLLYSVFVFLIIFSVVPELTN